jgi:hypothetical protein
MTAHRYTPRDRGGYDVHVGDTTVGYLLPDIDGWSYYEHRTTPVAHAELIRVEATRDHAVTGVTE